MTRPKGKLFALLAIFMAIGIVTATGAFTSVSATRTATVDAVGDQNAIVALEPFAGPNGYAPTAAASAAPDNSYGYAQLTDKELTLNLGGYDAGTPQNQGVNYNASTQYENVFNITNTASSDVYLYITASGDQPSSVVFYNATSFNSGADITTQSQRMVLGAGNTVSVSIEVDTQGIGNESLSSSQLVSSIDIHADNVNQNA